MKPSISASIDVHSGCGPVLLNFTNNSTGYDISHSWSFGNGNFSNLASPAPLSYNQGKISDTTYYINLTVSNYCGSVSFNDSVLVYPKPIVNFITNINEGCSPIKISFANFTTGNPINFIWNYGDGAFSNKINPPDHIYYTDTKDSIYNISLIASNNCGFDTALRSITVHPNTINAFFKADTISGCAPLKVNFTNYTIGAKVFNWDLGDGNFTSSKDVSHTYSSGKYDVVLYANTECSYDTASVSINVFPVPTISFNIDQDTVCLGQAVKLKNTSLNINDINYSFGDGQSSNLANPIHYFLKAGSYEITAKGTSFSYNCPASSSKIIVVLPQPKAVFSISQDSLCQPMILKPKNSSSDSEFFLWNFGDGNTTSIFEPEHIYQKSGNFKTTLICSNYFGCSDTAKLNLFVKPKPISNFSHNIKSLCSFPVLVEFKNESKGSSTYSWDFGDGAKSSLVTPEHSFDLPKEYTVSLSVLNAFGCVDSIEKKLTFPSKPISIFKPSLLAGCLPLEIKFTNTSSNSNYYFWDFGDGNSSNITSPAITFKKEGAFEVKLISYNNTGCKDSLKTTILVYPKPEASFVSSANYSCFSPVLINFTNTSKGAISYLWNFGYILKSNENNPSVNFTSEGNYQNTLIASTAFGCTDTVRKDFTVFPTPVSNFTSSIFAGCEPLTVEFLNNSNNSDSSYWDFGDGTLSYEKNPVKVYESSGVFSVSLNAISGNGFCVDKIKKDNYITTHKKPDADFDYKDTDNPSRGIVQFTNLSSHTKESNWEFGDGTFSEEFSPLHRYEMYGNHKITLISNNEFCADTLVRNVDVNYFKGLFVPNAFTPESGPENVRGFLPSGIGIKKYNIKIYDTWGNLIWESSKLNDNGSPAEPWYGDSKDILSQQDVYVWKIDAEFLDGTIWNGKKYDNGLYLNTGTVTLIK